MTLAMRDQMMIEKGRDSTLYMLVQDGKITPLSAAEVMGIKQSQLKDQMTAEGYKWPEDKEQ